MRELTAETITDAVLDQMATTPDARIKEVMAAAVRHLHAFAREVNVTPGEWIKGVEVMTLLGKMCTRARQELILLSDILGLSALVSGLQDKTALEEAIHTNLLGLFYREASPKLAAGSHLADDLVFGSSDDLAVDIAADDPDCPIEDVPSTRFDLKLSGEGEANTTGGRVGSDPAAILKGENAKVAAPAPAAS